MFCMHCGKQLDDNSRFCIYCGNPIGGTPAAVPDEQTVSAAPVTEVPAEEAPVMETPEVIPEETVAAEPAAVPPVQTPTVSETPQPVPVAPPVYTPPVPPVKEEKPKKEKKEKGKKGKAGPIIAIVLVLLLLIGGGVGYYLYTQHVYEENLAAYDAAELLLKKQDYDGALAAFQDLGDFEDAADRAEELEQLQADYDEALELLEKQEYDKAAKAFGDLGDYRDSENYVENEIDYQKASNLMADAAAADISDAQNIYLDAAALFAELDDYSDSAELESECLLNSALIELHWADYSAAMDYMEHLNIADQDALREAYEELCADAVFLSDIENIMLSLFPNGYEAPSQEAVESALELLASYGTAHFDMDGLEDYPYYFATYIEELNYAANDYNWVNFYYYTYYLYQCVDELYEYYGAFTDSALYDAYVGKTSGLEALYSMEYFLNDWWENTAVCYYDSYMGYYTELYNTSGYDATITFSAVYYDTNGNYLYTDYPVTYEIANGDTVYIYLDPSEDIGDDWRWSLDWYYTVYH